jgi:hypothetical protein
MEARLYRRELGLKYFDSPMYERLPQQLDLRNIMIHEPLYLHQKRKSVMSG